MEKETCIPYVDQIGETAGDIWGQLTEHGPMSLTRLVKNLGLPRDQVMQGVGWLAREGKIDIVDEARRRMISLR